MDRDIKFIARQIKTVNLKAQAGPGFVPKEKEDEEQEEGG
jgi:hypothetical protein